MSEWINEYRKTFELYQQVSLEVACGGSFQSENFEPIRFNPLQDDQGTFNSLFFYQFEIDINLKNKIVGLSKDSFGTEDLGRWIVENFSQSFDRKEWTSEVINESDNSPIVRQNWKLQHAMANYNRQMQLAGQGFSTEEINHSFFI